ncbi:DUF4403 family protein [Rhabdobacter roseus]|uniref:DUF4403 family protein n=1 Tax=Rhabdobacter roseus TaxID=1655419 RepID=UPI001FE9DC7B|nr:DUF4403 family protein [Rhabdobacter roseus]
MYSTIKTLKKRNLATEQPSLKLSKRRWCLLALCGLLLLGQCTPKKTSQPSAPAEKYLYSDMQIQNEKYLSTFNVPVEMPIAELEKQINAQLKGLIYEDNSYEDDGQDNLKAKIWKLSDIKVQALDSTFLFEVPLKIWVSAGYKISPMGFTMSGYKDTEFAVRLRFISKVSVSPDWRMLTTTHVDSYDWISEPSIKVSGFNIPIKGMVSRLLNRNSDKITQAIDEQVGKAIELRKYVQQAWDLAHNPVLMSEEYNTWLVVLPNQILMTPLLARSGVLRTSIGIKGYTQTITSSVKPLLKTDPLPPLRVVEKIPAEFKVGLISLISYAEAARLAEANFVGKQFAFMDGRYAVEVTSIALFGQNEKLVIKAGLKGSLNGFIYLKGTPTYDPDTKMLSLHDLDYDLDTRNVIFKTANWLLQGKFARMMEKQMVFPLGEQMEEAKKGIQQTLSRRKLADGVELRGTLNEVLPDKVYLTPEHIYAVVFATGKVNIRIEGLL